MLNMTKTRTAKPRIRQNAWGNWYGYIGNRKVEMFFDDVDGDQEQHAKRWLAKQLGQQGDDAPETEQEATR